MSGRSTGKSWRIGRSMGALVDTIRADAWWEHKLAPMLGSGYMTAFFVGASLGDVWPALALTLAALTAAAAYVSLINDLTDIDDDRVAGKRNRLAGRPAAVRAAGVAACLAIGTGAILAWAHDPLAAGLYAGVWLAFSLYSIPPLRLKRRGIFGVVADAAGAHVFPQLLVVVVVFHRRGTALDVGWIAAVAVWAAAHGVRGALWHQLADVDVDARAGVRTFARVHPRRARVLARAAFAVELAAFGLLLWRSHNSLAFALLVPYFALEALRSQLWGVKLVIAGRAPVFRIAMHEYYIVLYPLSFLIAASIRHPLDALVLVAHVALFHRTLADMTRHVARALRESARRSLVAER
jgi:4-hydroxybenzoate polyprenyltransferase